MHFFSAPAVTVEHGQAISRHREHSRGVRTRRSGGRLEVTPGRLAVSAGRVAGCCELGEVPARRTLPMFSNHLPATPAPAPDNSTASSIPPAKPQAAQDDPVTDAAQRCRAIEKCAYCGIAWRRCRRTTLVADRLKLITLGSGPGSSAANSKHSASTWLVGTPAGVLSSGPALTASSSMKVGDDPERVAVVLHNPHSVCDENGPRTPGHPGADAARITAATSLLPDRPVRRSQARGSRVTHPGSGR